MNIDEVVAQALQTQFPTENIYHDNAPESNTYPLIVYTDLSETPALHADNQLYARAHVIRVTIVTLGNHDINILKKKVEDALLPAGFMWQRTNKVRDGKEYYTALDFSRGDIQ